MDDEVIEILEVDLEVSDIIDLLEQHGVKDWTPDLPVALWEWKEARLAAERGEEL